MENYYLKFRPPIIWQWLVVAAILLLCAGYLAWYGLSSTLPTWYGILLGVATAVALIAAAYAEHLACGERRAYNWLYSPRRTKYQDIPGSKQPSPH